MSKFNCCFHPNIPDECPPASAQHAEATIYRKINGRTPQKKDFEPDVVAKPRHSNRENCQCWGFSVWPDISSVKHAFTLPYFIRKRDKLTVVEGDVITEDGVIAFTPTNVQPRHHTFWVCHDKDLSSKFSKVEKNVYT